MALSLLSPPSFYRPTEWTKRKKTKTNHTESYNAMPSSFDNERHDEKYERKNKLKMAARGVTVYIFHQMAKISLFCFILCNRFSSENSIGHQMNWQEKQCVHFWISTLFMEHLGWFVDAKSETKRIKIKEISIEYECSLSKLNNVSPENRKRKKTNPNPWSRKKWNATNVFCRFILGE